MRASFRLLTFILVFLGFELALAFEPGVILEVPVDGKAVHGDILNGKLALSSLQGFQILSSQGKQLYRASLGPNHGLVFSDDGGFFGIVTYSEGASPGFLAAERFEFFSSDGNKLWEVENPEVSEFFISKDAEVIVGMSGAESIPESKVAFYNRNGELISANKVRLPQGLSFSSDGTHVLINSAKDGLMLFDETGKLKNRFEPCDRFAISTDGKYVATASEGNLRLYLDGKPASELKVGVLVRDMVFSPEGKILGAIDKKHLYLFQVETGKLLWRNAVEKTELSYISLDLSREGERAITGLDFDKGSKVSPAERHAEGLVLVFDKNGGLIWQEEISYKLWAAMFPLVQISEDGNRFSVTTREKVYLFDAGQPER